MTRYFADAAYFIALANPKDALHENALKQTRALSLEQRVTTDEVLTEFLNFYAEAGDFMRQKAADIKRSNRKHLTQ